MIKYEKKLGKRKVNGGEENKEHRERSSQPTMPHRGVRVKGEEIKESVLTIMDVNKF